MSPAETASAAAVPPGWDCHVHVFDAAAPVRAGHYGARHAPLEAIEPMAAAQGIGHLVLVQPSVYGTDNRVLLQALARTPGRHRGVVVLGATVDDAELERLHAAGVRGIRFNRVSPVGVAEALQTLPALAPRLRALGWHVQWYVGPHTLVELPAWQRRTGLNFVLDHLAGLPLGEAPPPVAAAQAADSGSSQEGVAVRRFLEPPRGAWGHSESEAWQALQRLADSGRTWVKLSAPSRLPGACDGPRHERVRVRMQVLARQFPGRLLWGSDWPHTDHDAGAQPPYATLWAACEDALGEAAALAMREAVPRALYR